MSRFIALFSGWLFGLGLSVASMLNPQKVQNFLNITGEWDPSLALTMGVALIVTATGVHLSKQIDKPFYFERFEFPIKKHIDARLILGATIFGVGWGLVGYCPGPAIASIVYGMPQTGVFVASMLIGMYLAKKI